MKLIDISQYTPNPSATLIPLQAHRVEAGFPSPADDYTEQQLDLNEHLIAHPSATYFARANGDSLQDLGILSGDLLIIDRSISAQHGDIVIAAINGELTCKILDTHQQRLLSANSDYPPIIIPEEASMIIEGVVIHAVHHIKNH